MFVSFDATSRVDEVLCVVFRFVTKQFKIIQKLVSLKKYKKCKNHEELVGAIFEIMTLYNVDKGNFSLNKALYKHGGVIAFMKDRAAVNDAAYGYFVRAYVGSKNLHCLSHTFTHVGEHITTEELTALIQDIQALCNSQGGVNKAANHWIECFPHKWRNPGNTRWWAKWELVAYIYVHWENLVTFATTGEIEGDVICAYALIIIIIIIIIMSLFYQVTWREVFV